MRKMVLAALAATMLCGSAEAAVSYTYTGFDFLGAPIGFTYVSPTFITGDTGSISATNFTNTVGGVGSARFLSSCPLLSGMVCDELDVTAGISTSYSYFADHMFQGVGIYSTVAGSRATLSITQLADAPSVPEPVAWAMMVAGFGLVGAAMRRRKVAVSFA